MYAFAYICLLVCLLVSLLGGSIALLYIWAGGVRKTRIFAVGQWVCAALLSLASALLLHALYWRDYSLEYVASYVDATLPVFYRLTAFWAGQAGSVLFWTLIVALSGAVFAFTRAPERLDNRSALWFWAYSYGVLSFFCLLLTCWNNPFVILEPIPADGSGLNPLLQNPGMIFHPPLLFMGYALFTVPACAALAQLTAAVSSTWHKITRPYYALGWIFLTAGIVLGAWWAYMELGWGGYWAWDPVENASLLPWLMACAAVHALVVFRHSGKLARTAAVFMALTVVSAVFGAYLTRSGVIQSVHAFGDGGVGTPLLVFVIFSFLLILAAGLTAPKEGESLASPLTREGLALFSIWLFVALTLIILVATVWPVLTHLAGSTPRGLDASFYNRVCLPLAAILIALMAVCAWFGRGSLSSAGIKRLIACSGAFVASAAVLWISGYSKPLPLLSASAALAALCSMSIKALNPAAWKSSRALCALGAHFGVALMALGIAFSGPYSVEKDLALAKGEKDTVGPYTAVMEDVTDGTGPGYDYLRATLKIEYDGKLVGTLRPERRMYAKFGDMQFSEVDVISTLGEDVYSSLLGIDETYKVYVKISVEPLVNWIWIGGVIACLLPFAAVLFLGGRKRIPAEE